MNILQDSQKVQYRQTFILGRDSEHALEAARHNAMMEFMHQYLKLREQDIYGPVIVNFVMRDVRGTDRQYERGMEPVPYWDVIINYKKVHMTTYMESEIIEYQLTYMPTVPIHKIIKERLTRRISNVRRRLQKIRFRK